MSLILQIMIMDRVVRYNNILIHIYIALFLVTQSAVERQTPPDTSMVNESNMCIAEG